MEELETEVARKKEASRTVKALRAQIAAAEVCRRKPSLSLKSTLPRTLMSPHAGPHSPSTINIGARFPSACATCHTCTIGHSSGEPGAEVLLPAAVCSTSKTASIRCVCFTLVRRRVCCAQADGLQLGAEQQHLKRQEAALAERLSRLEVQVRASPRS